MPQYPESKLDRAVGSAIARENAAVIEEERTGEPVNTPEREFLRDVFSGMEEDIEANPERYPELSKRLAERKVAAELPMDLISVLERRIVRLEERAAERERYDRGAGDVTQGRISELSRTIVLLKAAVNEGDITMKGVDPV